MTAAVTGPMKNDDTPGDDEKRKKCATDPLAVVSAPERSSVAVGPARDYVAYAGEDTAMF